MDPEEKKGPKFRDIRKYYCEYCGVCRSKKVLLASHILASHQEEVKEREADCNVETKQSNTCEKCGASFRKPAYLKQHMQSHSLERPFTCPVDDCNSSYRRKDHLNRHLLQHKGKLFACPVENCTRTFALQGNIKKHVKHFHEESKPSEPKLQKQFVCQETSCGKVFKYASKLRKHEDSHVKLESVEAMCCEPGCLKHFTNAKCLKAHVQSCHQRLVCEVCGTKQLKKNIKRHMRTHEEVGGSTERIKCQVEGCLRTYTTITNLRQHVKAVHFELTPFACRIAGCGMRFSFRHVRDNHEKTGCHVHTEGDFVESDEYFRSRPRGGRKRKCPSIEALLRKRVALPNRLDEARADPSDYVAWLLSQDSSSAPAT